MKNMTTVTKEKLGLVGDGQHDDTAAIQALLDKAGEVYIPGGCYCITHPLIIHDNTHLRLAANAVLRLADHVNCSILDNDGLYRRCTNRNIVIEGGIWDGNHDNQEREQISDETQPCDYDTYVSNALLVLMVRLVHTEHLTVRNLTFKNPTSYAIHIADAKYFHVENIKLDYDLTKLNMDGVHVNGPARFGIIRNIMGDANDDHVSLCANGTARSGVTDGVIEDVIVDGVYCENGYTGVRLLSWGDAIRNVRVSNVHGAFRYYAVSFTHHYPLGERRESLLENVHLSDICASKSTGYVPKGQQSFAENGALIWFESGIRCRNVLVENVYRKECNTFTKAPTVRISPNVQAENFVLRNICQEFIGEEAPLLSNEAGVQIEQ